MKVKVNLPAVETSRQRKEVTISSEPNDTMKSFFYRIGLQREDLFISVFGNSKTALCSVFTY